MSNIDKLIEYLNNNKEVCDDCLSNILDIKPRQQVYKVEEKIVYIGRCLGSFSQRINNGYANISPKNCYLDGQSTNCRINNLVNKNREKIKLFIYESADDNLIKELEIKLIKEYKPEWNIQGI